MSVDNWLAIIGIIGACMASLWVMLRKDIMREVQGLINDAMNKIKDDKIKELSEALGEERHKNDYLKERIKDLK